MCASYHKAYQPCEWECGCLILSLCSVWNQVPCDIVLNLKLKTGQRSGCTVFSFTLLHYNKAYAVQELCLHRGLRGRMQKWYHWACTDVEVRLVYIILHYVYIFTFLFKYLKHRETISYISSPVKQQTPSNSEVCITFMGLFRFIEHEQLPTASNHFN